MEQEIKTLKETCDAVFKNYFQRLKDEKCFDCTPRVNPIHTRNIYDAFLGEIEKSLILETLKFNRYNQVKTAKALNMSRNTLRKLIEKYEIGK